MNTPLPLCTIMIPTYNQAGYLRKTIDSALAQDYPNLEVIVADDNSNDSTRELLKSYNDKRLRWHTNTQNLGRVANYNNLLYQHANGKWVLNLDGDDFLIDTSFISSAIRLAESNPETVLVFADRYEKEDPITEMATTNNAAHTISKPLDGMSYVLSWPRKKCRIHHLTTLYNREKAIEINFYNQEIISSDYESLFRLMLHGAVFHLPAKVAVWRYHSQNASTNKSTNDKVNDLLMFDTVTKYAIKIHPELRRKFSKWRIKNLKRKYYTFLLSSYKKNDNQLPLLNEIIDKHYPGIRWRVLISPFTWLKIARHLIKN